MTHCEDCGRPVTLRRKLGDLLAEWLCAHCNVTYLRSRGES